MKGRNWRKSLAACMALATVACSTPQQSASELVNGLTFTAKALEEPTTNSETIENSSPVDEETQKSEMQPVEETPSENEATNEETPENPDEDTAPKLLYGKVMSKMPLAAASATNGLSYISRSWDASSKQVVETQATYTGQYIKLSDQASNDSFTLTGSQNGEGVWYYVDRWLTFNGRCRVTGTVNLVLKDGVELMCTQGIICPTGSTLNIYTESDDTGRIIANSKTNNSAAIGGDEKQGGGTIRVFGGAIYADAKTNSKYAAGIGGGGNGPGGTFEMYGGSISVNGGENGAGIGGGENGAGSTVNIYGGKVTATGGSEAAGIGSGYKGVGGIANINGGTVIATGGSEAAGIGSGYNGVGGIANINGGTVTATGGKYGAGIGGGYHSNSGNITINGGTVNAYGRDGGAGIGDGAKSDDAPRTITVNGGDITAVGGANAAGIGGGNEGKNAYLAITIKDCEKIDAIGGTHAAGIGGGYYYANSGKIVIDGGSNISAKGGIGDSSDAGGAGIGTGAYCFQTDSNAVNVTINGGTIEAVGGSGYVYGNKSYNLPGAAIGAGGYSYFNGSINLNGGDITAVSGDTVNNYGSYDTSSAPKNTTSVIGTTTEKYFSDGSGSVNFNGATVTMKLKSDLTGKYPMSVRANSIAINDENVRQRVVYSDDITWVYANYSERKREFEKGHSNVRVEPCTLHNHFLIAIGDVQHRLQ